MDHDHGAQPPSIEYLAGFLDGEGCFSTNGRILVSSTDRRVLRDLADLYGGSVHPKVGRIEHHADAFQWIVPRETTVKLIPALLKHLRTKREAARVSLELSTLPRLHPVGPASCDCLQCDQVRAARDTLQATLSDLNRTGS